MQGKLILALFLRQYREKWSIVQAKGENMNHLKKTPPFTFEIKGIKKTYGYKRKVILEDISLTAHGGECIGILGTNGCGKSTLLSILAGIRSANSGTFTTHYEETIKSSSKPAIGYVPQENPLMEELTALDNLRLWYSNSPLDLQEELEHGTLQLLGIPNFLHTRVSQMSGGMKKRLNIGCAIASDPQILLLDEPGAALDLPCKEQINQYLQSYKEQGNLIFIATHEEPEIALCDRLFLLKDGVLVPYEYDGNLSTLIASLAERNPS